MVLLMPPGERSFSKISTRRLAFTSSYPAARPAGPAPITTTSNFCAPAISFFCFRRSRGENGLVAQAWPTLVKISFHCCGRVNAGKIYVSCSCAKPGKPFLAVIFHSKARNISANAPPSRILNEDGEKRVRCHLPCLVTKEFALAITFCFEFLGQKCLLCCS